MRILNSYEVKEILIQTEWEKGEKTDMETMKSMKEKFELANGTSIPCIGYGTYKTPIPETCEAVLAALKAGYRHMDTAAAYKNESGVGRAVRESGIAREEIFVTSKVWNTERGYDKTRAAFEKTLKELGLEYLDLYLIHWPANYRQFGKEAKRINAETWKALEDLYREGRVKAIGVSNFLPHHIEELMETAEVKPMVDQIEFHPGWAQKGVVRYCHDNGIVVEAWSPLGRREVLEHPVLVRLAEKYGKSAAQICLRWELQHGVLPLPKSANPARMAENTQVFDFVISGEDMAALDELHDIGGKCSLPDEIDF